MTWTKLSDDFTDDCERLSDAAFRLHVEALTWTNRKLLNCRIPIDDLRRFAKHPEAVSELLARGWWEVVGDEYVIIHHAVYQRDREAVLRQQAANSENGAKGGRPPGPPRERAPRPSAARTPVTFIPESESLSESASERDRPAGIAKPTTSTTTGTSQENESLSESLNESESERDSTPKAPAAKVAAAKASQAKTSGEPAPSGWVVENGVTRRAKKAAS